ncbi:hypothetical protein [Pseudooceanicola sp. LIPI14-2-Ac024]
MSRKPEVNLRLGLTTDACATAATRRARMRGRPGEGIDRAAAIRARA